MKDLEILLENKPGSLALMGEILGSNRISLEGGGVFPLGSRSVAHFLVKEADRAAEVLASAGFGVIGVHEVLLQRLRQDIPGQLGLFCRRLADAGVNIIVQYSDHDNQLVLVVDDYEKGRVVSEKWKEQF